ncbi:unnamed protein product [Parnassius apollo]|uniref:(apollo) hypothetical protein n=1 Tax=Parnassius apollo TaxID=110799 RepID=A0A8S3XAU2_PARAO|nr:unnamed protein product [Parnassius apollo]
MRGKGGKYKPPWWLEELEAQKLEIIKLHHRIQEAKRRGLAIEDLVQQHMTLKAAYAQNLRAESTRSFRDFCSLQTKENVWSLTNRLLKESTARRPPTTLKINNKFTADNYETATALLNHFYPPDLPDTDPRHHELTAHLDDTLDTNDEPPFTSEEVLEHLSLMNPNKAPGTELEKAINKKGLSKESIEEIKTPIALDETVVEYTECILEACNKIIPIIKRKQMPKAAKWWNAELKEKKDEMIRIRRRIKNAHPKRKNHVIQQYLIAKEEYTRNIERASTKSWKELCTKEEKETIWQRTYRILKVCTNREEDKLLRDQNGELLSTKESAVLLAKTFYPDDNSNTDTEEQTEIREKVKRIYYSD